MKQKIYTASEARSNLYSLIRQAASGEGNPKIHLQGTDQPVLLISEEEFEGWIETLDILSIPGALEDIKEGTREADMRLGRKLSE